MQNWSTLLDLLRLKVSDILEIPSSEMNDDDWSSPKFFLRVALAEGNKVGRNWKRKHGASFWACVKNVSKWVSKKNVIGVGLHKIGSEHCGERGRITTWEWKTQRGWDVAWSDWASWTINACTPKMATPAQLTPVVPIISPDEARVREWFEDRQQADKSTKILRYFLFSTSWGCKRSVNGLSPLRQSQRRLLWFR